MCHTLVRTKTRGLRLVGFMSAPVRLERECATYLRHTFESSKPGGSAREKKQCPHSRPFVLLLSHDACHTRRCLGLLRKDRTLCYRIYLFIYIYMLLYLSRLWLEVCYLL